MFRLEWTTSTYEEVQKAWFDTQEHAENFARALLCNFRWVDMISPDGEKTILI